MTTFQHIFGKHAFSSIVMLTLGSIIAAFAIEEFLAPNEIFDGGVTGISMILEHYVSVPLGLLILLINTPFLIFGYTKLGHAFVIKVIYSILLFSFMTSIFSDFVNATNDEFLATIFGGVFLGIGVGLVFRGGGCLDGTEVVATYLSRKVTFSTSQIVLFFNILIYTIAGFIFGMDRGMYSLIMYFITSHIIDIVEVGLDTTKSVMIITDDGKRIASDIYHELGRTVTFLKGQGLVSKDSKDILYCVVTRAEIFDLKKIIENVEGSSFTTITDVSEVVGTHIKSNNLNSFGKNLSKN